MIELAKLATNLPQVLTSLAKGASTMSTTSDPALIRRNLLKTRNHFQNPAYRPVRHFFNVFDAFSALAEFV